LDGAEAIAVAKRYSGEIHLLLTDVVMPGMNGKELSERLIAMRPGLKVLFVSGYTANVIAHGGVIDHDIAYMAKPFSPDGLAAKVRKVLAAPAKPTVGT
jgi:two-component system sensor histidine kinase EvgS